MRLIVAVAVLLLLGPHAAIAQPAGSLAVDPCAQPAQGAVTWEVGKPLAFTFCNPPEDVPFGYTVKVDGTTLIDRAFTKDEWTAVAGVKGYSTPPGIKLTAGVHTVSFYWHNAAGLISQPFNILVTVPESPACAFPLGAEAVSVFPTRWEQTTKAVGSRMRINYQLASKSPVREVQVRVDGVTVETQIGSVVDLKISGGMWFVQPPAGRHRLTVYARNDFGCTREVETPVGLNIK